MACIGIDLDAGEVVDKGAGDVLLSRVSREGFETLWTMRHATSRHIE